jgi:hypothetical protein
MCVVVLAGVPLYQKFWTAQSSLMRAQRNKLVCQLLSPSRANYYSFLLMNSLIVCWLCPLG